MSEIISCLPKYPFSPSPRWEFVLLKRWTFPYSLTAWDGHCNVIESHWVGLLGNLFKTGLTQLENTSICNFLLPFSSELEYRYDGWRSSSYIGQWGSFENGSLLLRKVEDNQVTGDCGASISALDCLSWDFYGREKFSKSLSHSNFLELSFLFV